MSLDRAIEDLQAEISAFGQGTKDQPKENTTEWFRLRALAVGLSTLKRMKQLGLGEKPHEAQAFYRNVSKAGKISTETELTP